MQCWICAPENYYDDGMQNYINAECADPDKQWIYKLINQSEGRHTDSPEDILLNEKEWFMCHNFSGSANASNGTNATNGTNGSAAAGACNEIIDTPSPGIDSHAAPHPELRNALPELDAQSHDTRTRYLVIFKNLDLKTLRDLRGHHVEMLLEMQEIVRNYLLKHHGARQRFYNIFFHYLPSVFQLHAHVSPRRVTSNNIRRQPVNVVVRNLRANTLHYKTCLLYTTPHFAARRQLSSDERSGPREPRSAREHSNKKK